MQSKKLKIHCADGVHEVTAYPIDLDCCPKNDFFLCFYKNQWRVSEWTTGYMVGSESTSRDYAIKLAEARVSRHAKDGSIQSFVMEKDTINKPRIRRKQTCSH